MAESAGLADVRQPLSDRDVEIVPRPSAHPGHAVTGWPKPKPITQPSPSAAFAGMSARHGVALPVARRKAF
ncbi:hypothetical protein [Streptomyces toxytricini]|uniref:hypothetical protein n=1 Tax=Streptomyces toxytricini TaxID=67369 RepID=UPI0034383198